MLLIIASVTMPLLGLLALNRIFLNDITKERLYPALKYTAGICIGLCLFMVLFGTSFISAGKADAQMQEALLSAIEEDRASMLRMDALRTLFFVVLGLGALWAVIADKIKKEIFAYIMIFIIGIDMFSFNKNYLNADDFVTQKKFKNYFDPYPWEAEILKDKDPGYRVINLSSNFTTDSRTSYFFNNIGGYHGSKSARYQDLINKQISKNNMEVLNMLNTRYFIMGEEGKQPKAQRNPDANGTAWYVKSIQWVNSPDEEMNALYKSKFKSKFKSKDVAIIDKKFETVLSNFIPQYDSMATIILTKYDNDKLIYETNVNSDQLAVFSEMYYQPGWTVTIDGKNADHVRADYVLRAMKIPTGKHKIEFTFFPPSYKIGKPISLIGSALLLIFIVAGIVMDRKVYQNKNAA